MYTPQEASASPRAESADAPLAAGFERSLQRASGSAGQPASGPPSRPRCSPEALALLRSIVARKQELLRRRIEADAREEALLQEEEAAAARRAEKLADMLHRLRPLEALARRRSMADTRLERSTPDTSPALDSLVPSPAASASEERASPALGSFTARRITLLRENNAKKEALLERREAADPMRRRTTAVIKDELLPVLRQATGFQNAIDDVLLQVRSAHVLSLLTRQANGAGGHGQYGRRRVRVERAPSYGP